MSTKHTYNTRSKSNYANKTINYYENETSDDSTSNSSDSEYNETRCDEYEYKETSCDESNSDDNDSEFPNNEYSNNKLFNKNSNSINKKNYYKFLNQIFPSNYTEKLINKDERKNKHKSKKRRLNNPSINVVVYQKPNNVLNDLLEICNNKIKQNNNNADYYGDNDDYDNGDNDHYDNGDNDDYDNGDNDDYNNGDNDDYDNRDNNDYDDGYYNRDDDYKNNKKKSNTNLKEFKKSLNTEKPYQEDTINYFKKMTLSKQLVMINKLKQINNTGSNKPYIIHLLELDIPNSYKSIAFKKINVLEQMSECNANGEYYKLKSWIDCFMKLPFNKYNNLPLTFADNIKECQDFIENAKTILDSVVYGLDEAKMQILQLIGLWLINPNAIGTSIALKGPMGTGKTSIVKHGISKILNRPFALIPLGGCNDSGYLDGHDQVYEGGKYGKIIDILIQTQCMNPVILFDELDKLSDTPRGEEITGILTHLTDNTQNTNFQDKYLSELQIDMSRALYIFSYNNESSVNPILKDRMYKIETHGYKTSDKILIAKNYLLKTIISEIKFKLDEIVISDNIYEYIINNFCENEDGVRNLKRNLEIIYSKLNLFRLMNSESDIIKKFNIKTTITFPLTLNTEIIDKLLCKHKKIDVPFGMYN